MAETMKRLRASHSKKPASNGQRCAGSARLVLIAALTGLFLPSGAAAAADAAEIRTMDFAVRNDREKPLDEVVRVSLPVPAGLIQGEPPQSVSSGAERVAAQAHIITRHPDGSARRLMLSFPVRLGAKANLSLTCEPGTASEPEAAPPLVRTDDKTAIIRTDRLDLELPEDSLEIRSKGGSGLGAIRPFGPSIADAQVPTLTVLENGPLFAWLRWQQDGQLGNSHKGSSPRNKESRQWKKRA